MGSRGPAPKRSDQRRRRNTTSESGESLEVTKAPAGSSAPPAAPDPDESWHPTALLWYRSLAESGQSYFYEPSDWAAAYVVAESMSRDLKPQVVHVDEAGEVTYATVPIKGANLAAYLKAMSSLLVTEADRRRVRIELQRGAADDDEDAAVVALDDYQRRLGGAG
jgi:hypothetical protein